MSRTLKKLEIDSTNIGSVKFIETDLDKKTGTLTIGFNSGSFYNYADVPYTAAEALVGASSVGGYFYRHIKDSYKATKVGDDNADS